MFNKDDFYQYIKLSGLSIRQISYCIGICSQTFYRKLKKNGDFNKGEIDGLCRILKIQNPGEIFFATNLTETQKV